MKAPKEFQKEHKGVYLVKPRTHGVQKKIVSIEDNNVWVDIE